MKKAVQIEVETGGKVTFQFVPSPRYNLKAVNLVLTFILYDKNAYCKKALYKIKYIQSTGIKRRKLSKYRIFYLQSIRLKKCRQNFAQFN